ncbi:DUF724 domain-containing protein 1-like [Ziziphus jujuba]|uniref:DUF724 domain-containing protein 1-like n=1 Tax=Ziziphus jujuba TaxID=326968 RepID=A0ABM4AFN3_ZIZJJ|nr:DUF724 domain-containing protein 1-like [Ziziphus jujuba]
MTYSPDYKPQYLHACNSTKNSTVATRNESSGARMENTEEEASCSTNKGYSQKEQQKNGAGVVAVDCTTDKVKLPMTAHVEVPGDQLNRAADVRNCRTDKSELTVEVTGSEDALRDGTDLVSATDCLAEEVMVAVDGISSNSVSDNQPLSMSFNEIHSIENANDSVIILENLIHLGCQPYEIGSTGDIEQNNGPCLPFVKTFPIWQQFESMEAFRRLPQNPHFQPLMESKEIYREGFAIGNMFAFLSLVQMITKLEIEAPGELFIEATETLVEMERMGFNVEALQGRLNELQLIQVKLRQLENDSKGVKTKITNSVHKRTKVNKEFYALCLEMKKLEEKKARLITETVATSTELDMWQSENADILENIQRM